MRRLEVENQLRDVVSRIIVQVKLATSQGRTDINLALEDAAKFAAVLGAGSDEMGICYMSEINLGMDGMSRHPETHIEFEPDIGGVSAGSMMIQPICAFGSLGGASRLTWRKTPPRGSFKTKLRSVLSSGMNRDCSHMVLPGGGETPRR